MKLVVVNFVSKQEADTAERWLTRLGASFTVTRRGAQPQIQFYFSGDVAVSSPKARTVVLSLRAAGSGETPKIAIDMIATGAIIT